MKLAVRQIVTGSSRPRTKCFGDTNADVLSVCGSWPCCSNLFQTRRPRAYELVIDNMVDDDSWCWLVWLVLICVVLFSEHRRLSQLLIYTNTLRCNWNGLEQDVGGRPPRYAAAPVRAARCGPAPAHTRLACGAQRALLPVAVGAMNIDDVCDRRQTASLLNGPA